MSLTLKAEAGGCAQITSIALEAQALAHQLNVSVEFFFNEVCCVAAPGGSDCVLVQSYHEARRNGSSVAYSVVPTKPTEQFVCQHEDGWWAAAQGVDWCRACGVLRHKRYDGKIEWMIPRYATQEERA